MTTPNPVQAEATDDLVEIEFDGETYRVAQPTGWDLDVLEAYEDGKIVTMTRGLLGEAQWATYRSKPRTVADLGSFFEKIQAGLGLGN